MKYRFRQKKDKFQVQKLEGDKWKSRTLDAENIWNLLECPPQNTPFVSSPTKEEGENKGETFAQSILTEPQKEPEPRTLTDEEKEFLFKLTI